MSVRVLALTKYGPLAAATRQRFELYLPALGAAGFDVTFAPLLPDSHVRGLVQGRRSSLLSIASAYVARLRALVAARKVDLLWVHYELFPYLPGAFERLAGLWGRPVVVDYDDATFHTYNSSPKPVVRKLLAGKLEPLLRSASACCCGNAYLRDYAARFCPDSIILPTVVDTSRYVPADRSAGPVVVGWIGSPSTWRNVRPLLPLLKSLVAEKGIRVRAVGAGRAAEADRFDGLELVEWSEESEIAEVQGMDIGIMPLIDAPFERGKCGYKLIQYMACGIPTVASPVGVNATIVEPGRNGFLATGEGEWRAALMELIDDLALRRRLGLEGRQKAVESFSLQSQAPRLVDLFRSVVGGKVQSH